jgi:REP element-mobilizing transposase RayT
LPHFDGGAITQFVTFSLHDCFPRKIVAKWREELDFLSAIDAEKERRKRIEAYLDTGHGHAWLRDPYLANLVQQTILYHHDVRYRLHAWVVMPSHAHALLTLIEPYAFERILHNWKSYTSHKAVKYLKRKGPFWFHESYDRYIRNEEHFFNIKHYIEHNPVTAGLCAQPEDWPWSSAWSGFTQVGTPADS